MLMPSVSSFSGYTEKQFLVRPGYPCKNFTSAVFSASNTRIIFATYSMNEIFSPLYFNTWSPGLRFAVCMSSKWRQKRIANNQKKWSRRLDEMQIPRNNAKNFGRYQKKEKGLHIAAFIESKSILQTKIQQ